MSEKTSVASVSAKDALQQIESRLRNDGYDEKEVEEVCFAARAEVEDRLANSKGDMDFSDIIDNFGSPEFAPEFPAQTHGSNYLGLIALVFSLVILVLFATMPFVLDDESGGGAMLSLAIVVSPIGAILGWKTRHQLFGKIALGVSTLPIVGLCLSVMLYVLE